MQNRFLCGRRLYSPWTVVSVPAWVPSRPACPTDFKPASPRNYISQFLERNLFMYVYMPYWFCFSCKPWLIQGGRRHLLAMNSPFESIGNTRFGKERGKPGSQGEGLREGSLRPFYLRRNSALCPAMGGGAANAPWKSAPFRSSEAWGPISRNSSLITVSIFFVSYLQSVVLKWRGFFQPPALLFNDHVLLVQEK